MHLYVVPPYLGSNDAYISLVPSVVVNPSLLLADRAKLSGAALFDAYCRRRASLPVNFSLDLPALAGVANVGVSARIQAGVVHSVAAKWAADARLPDDFLAPDFDLANTPFPPEMVAAIDELIESTPGLGVAQITKMMACARPASTPMIDRYVRFILRASCRGDADYAEGETFAVYLARFRRLLLAQRETLEAIAVPPGLNYSVTEICDRALWLAAFGAEFYSKILDHSWVTVTGLPAVYLLGPAWQLNAYALKHARLVTPSSVIGVQRKGLVKYGDLNATQRAVVLELLEEANGVAVGMWGEP